MSNQRFSRVVARALMSTLVLIVNVFFIETVFSQDKNVSDKGSNAAESLQRLSWISGTWVLEEDGKTIEEHWRPVQGNSILGTSHTFDDKRTRFFEHLRITATDGQVAYIALPGGANGTVFLMSRLDEQAVVFENAKHDYPQRIQYEKTKEGVTATISRIDGSKSRKFVFKRKVEDNR